MNTDRELLELASKAAGMSAPWDQNDVFGVWAGSYQAGHWWNPLEDDGDALRLAVALKLDINFFRGFEEVSVQGDGTDDTSEHLGEPVEANEPFGSEIYAATRRAITRAAAEIGRSMK